MAQNKSASAAASAAAAAERAFAIQAKDNEKAVTVFTAAVLTLLGLIVGGHLVRQASHATPSTGRTGLAVATSRALRRLFLRKTVLFPTVGHGTLNIAYYALNTGCLFGFHNNANKPFLGNIAARAAWLAIANFALVVLFALKTNPLAAISPWSYERLNSLHRSAGFLAAVLAAVHGICYSTYFVNKGIGAKLLTLKEVGGMMAGGSFVLLALGGVLRKYSYEAFYVSHTIFWNVALAGLTIHQPLGEKSIMYVSAAAAGAWALQRIFRFARLAVQSANRTVTLTPLPHGATRVTFNKPIFGAYGGKHCFLWIPRIRFPETHPFTLASANPPQLVVEAKDGFTRALYQFAVDNPGRLISASIDGPYGTVPDPGRYETVLLVAGGTGATFLFGMANPAGRLKRMVLVWVVKYAAQLDWFAAQLAELKMDSRVSIHLYVTREAKMPDDDDHDEKYGSAVHSVEVQTSVIESRFVVNHGRPNIDGIVRAQVAATAAHEKILVAGCGPGQLMDEMRATAVDCMREGPSVELHCEQFGW